MSLAACVLLYGLVVAVIGPSLLARATRRGVAPRLGIAAWSAAALSVVGSWVLAGGLVAAEVWRARGSTEQLVRGCAATVGATLTGRHGAASQAGVLLVAVLAVLSMGVLGVRFGRALLRARRDSHRHSAAARVLGLHEVIAPGAIVLDTPERVAYCVAGRPATIVVTRGALATLGHAELAAVLAHERAHLAGRHHLLVAVSRALATAMPRLRLFTIGAAEIARLVEMRADDAAARRHGGRTVISALLALSGVPALPASALGATAVGVVERVERLLVPAGRGRVAASQLALLLGVGLLLLGPALGTTLLMAGAAVCEVRTG